MQVGSVGKSPMSSNRFYRYGSLAKLFSDAADTIQKAKFRVSCAHSPGKETAEGITVHAALAGSKLGGYFFWGLKDQLDSLTYPFEGICGRVIGFGNVLPLLINQQQDFQ
jgi:hypothetical protein